MILAIGTRKQDSQFTGFHITDSHSVPTPKAVGGFNRFNPSEHPSDQGTMARCPSRLYKRMFLSSRLRCVMSCVSHVSEGKDSVTSSNFFCSEPWREREGGRRDTRYISTASARETNLTISVLSRSRVRHLGCPNGFATPQGAACPACVCAFRSSVKSEVGVTGRVRTRHISPRQSPSHSARAAAPGPAQAAGGTRPAARGPSFSPLAHLLRPPSSCLSVRHPPSSHPLPKERTRA